MSNEPVRNHDMGAHGSYEHAGSQPARRDLFHGRSGCGRRRHLFHRLRHVSLPRLLRTSTPGDHEPHGYAARPIRAPSPHADTQAFPQPRLEENERTQLRQFIEDQDRKLATYNWVDKDKGIVQIPIDRAMDLIVQRGLPVRPTRPGENEQEQSASAKTHAAERRQQCAVSSHQIRARPSKGAETDRFAGSATPEDVPHRCRSQ